MGNLFTHHPKHGDITDADRAVLSLKAQRRKLEDQSKLLEARIDHNVAVARELVAAGKKERALLALKKKRLNEKQLDSVAAYLLNVEDVLSSMELSSQQQRVLTALKQGAAALKAAQAEWSVEDVERLMDETAEAREYQDRVSNALSAELSEGDTAAAEAELAALETAVSAGEAAADAAALPAAPTRAHEREKAAAAAAPVAAAAAEEEEERRREEPMLAA